jgi:hypothetical protein
MRSNRWEREVWFKWRPTFTWGNLCPIKFADPWGCIVIMRRAAPTAIEEIDAADIDFYPNIDVEFDKAENFGRLDGAVVAVDYGLFDESAVHERQEYLAMKAAAKLRG